MDFSERRAAPRLEFASGERPVLAMGERVVQVLDCSERGLRYLLDAEPVPAIGTEIAATIRFPGGALASIEGVVVRIQNRAVGVEFTGLWLAPELIEAEQRRLRGSARNPLRETTRDHEAH
ncbi:MAG: PilZ domain-containing protein [Gemmatimonadota bacterium]|nr:PilZ domain-containing protein [Gemmatimonadota bacterium]